MHEISIISQVIKRVTSEARRRRAKRVLEVELEVGQLSFLNKDQLIFAYSVLSKGTILDGSKLKIKIVEAYVKCQNCGFEGNPSYEEDASYHTSKPLYLCPSCSSPVVILEGAGCTIKRLRLQF